MYISITVKLNNNALKYTYDSIITILDGVFLLLIVLVVLGGIEVVVGGYCGG